MESGIIELAPIFKGSEETTAEEMKEYMQGVVARFCEVTGLVVIETVDHEKGASFIIGEEGKTQGLISIGNSSGIRHYYNVMHISTVGPLNEIRFLTVNGSQSTPDGQGYIFLQYPVFMNYIKTDYSIAIGMQTNQSPQKNPFSMAFHKIIYGNGTEELVMLRRYVDALYASYNPALLNEEKSTPLFKLLGFNKNIIPQDKEAVADIYLETGVVLPGMRMYTNKKNVSEWNKVRISGKQYLLAAKGSGEIFSLLMQASDTATKT